MRIKILHVQYFFEDVPSNIKIPCSKKNLHIKGKKLKQNNTNIYQKGIKEFAKLKKS